MTKAFQIVISSILNSLLNDPEIPENVSDPEESDCCPICLEEIDNFEKFLFVLCCGKKFCEKCSDTLIQNKAKLFSSCPMCRHKIPETASEGLELIKKSVEIGKNWAQSELADFYDTSSSRSHPSILKNDIESFRLYLLSARQGYLLAQFNVGTMYQCGRGVRESMKLSSYWLALAARQGSLLSQFDLALMMDRKQIHVKSVNDSFTLLQNAAFMGSSVAQAYLASKFQFHSAIPDVRKALFWYKKAALQNIKQAQFNISVILFDLKKDIPTAMYWLRKSAESGYIDAVKLLAQCEVDLAARCGACFQRLNGDGKRCTKCKSVYYCSRECQIEDWNIKHKKECVDEITE